MGSGQREEIPLVLHAPSYIHTDQQDHLLWLNALANAGSSSGQPLHQEKRYTTFTYICTQKREAYGVKYIRR